MLTLLAIMARRFNKRIAFTFVGGIVAGALLLSLLLANHLRQVCHPVGVAGIFVCKVS